MSAVNGSDIRAAVIENGTVVEVKIAATEDTADFFRGLANHTRSLLAAQEEYFGRHPILAALRKLGWLPDPYMPARLYALNKVGRAFPDIPRTPSV